MYKILYIFIYINNDIRCRIYSKVFKIQNKYIELKKYAEQIGLGDAIGKNYRCIVDPDAVGTIGEGKNMRTVHECKDISQEELNLIKKKENEIKTRNV